MIKIDNIDIAAQLFALQDKTYADFQSKLLPTVARETVIGVRTPDLRKMAKHVCKTPAAQEFMQALPQWLQCCIDYSAVWRNLDTGGDYNEVDGHIFRN